MTKTFCDRCGRESFVEKVSLVIKRDDVIAETLRSIDACKSCIARLKDACSALPQESPAS
jgi:hypothetical protein